MRASKAKTKKRGKLLTAWLIFMLIANSLVALVYFFIIIQRFPFPSWDIPILAALSALNGVFTISLFKWKKWGVYGFGVNTLIAFIINLSIGIPVTFAILGLLGLGILLLLLRPVWNYLEEITITIKRGAIIGAVATLAAVGIIAAVLTLPPPGYRRYSKFGFSFEYPEGMTLSEQGLFEPTANDSSGMIWIRNSGDDFYVVWARSFPGVNISQALENSLQRAEALKGATNFVRGERIETTKAGYQLVYQDFTYTFDDHEVFGIIGVLGYDVKNTRYLFQHYYLSQVEPLLTFQRFLDSFFCH